MTSVAPIQNDQDFADGAPSALQMVDAAALDSQLAQTKNKINALLVALALVIRDDDTLVDAIVRLRNLHPEILTAIAARDAWQPKVSVACASTANLTLSGEQTIDGVLTSASRVLVKDQTAPAENGIYVTAAGAWTRATDADAATELGLACVLVLGGTLNANSAWVQTVVAASITVGTTGLVWAQYTGVTGSTPVSRGGTGQAAIAAWPTYYRRPARVAASTSTNIASPGATIDGVALSAGDRVLLTAQATASQNGLWVWNGAAVAMSRPVDYAVASTVQAFQDVVVNVLEGTTNGGAMWRLTTAGAITVDTTNTAWLVVGFNASRATGALPSLVASASPVKPTGAVSSRTLADRFADVINVKDFGALGDNATDDTVAVQAAVDAAAASANRAVFFPVGRYVLTAPITVKGGVPLSGFFAMSSTEQVGTTLKIAHAGHGIVFDGTTGTDFQVVGGGVRDMMILKANGFSGGDAIKVSGVNDNRRPGDLVFDNVLVSAAGTGLWARGLNMDGSALSTVGSVGIRNCQLRRFRVANCTVDNEYIVLNQVTHLHGMQVQVDTGSGTGICGLTVKGTSQNIDLGVVINGNLIIDAASTVADAVFHGRCGNLAVNATNTTGAFFGTIVNSPIVNKAADFIVSAPFGPAFEGQLTAAVANATGDGTAVNLSAYTEDFDKNGDFDAPSGVFTATVAGWYHFRGAVVVQSAGAAHTLLEVSIVTTTKTKAHRCNPYATQVPSGSNSYAEVDAVVFMNYGDTAKLRATVSGGTKTVGINYDASVWATRFGGHMVKR